MHRNGMEEQSDQLVLQVNRASNQAYQLAKQAYLDGHGVTELMTQAQQLNVLLDEFWLKIQNAPAELQPELSRAWSDARLDVGYVLSHGELSTSTRLFHFIESQKSAGGG